MAIKPTIVRRDLNKKPEPQQEPEQEQESLSFSSILDQQVEDAERPKPIPTGSYICLVAGLPRYDKSTQQQTEYAEFTLQPLEPYKDVDTEELEKMGGLENRTLRYTLWLTEDSKYRLRKFIEDCGITIKGKSFAEAIEELPGQQVIANVVHGAAKDGSAFYANVKSTAKV